VIAAATEERIALCTSAALLEELAEVLGRAKFIARLQQAQRTVAQLIEPYRGLVELVEPTQGSCPPSARTQTSR